jgi:hypothetical protein
MYPPSGAPYTHSAQSVSVTAPARSDAAPRRVALVLLAVAMMGVADLLFTLTYMTNSGMMEMNPLARLAVSLGGVNMLVKFKLLTILLSAGILYCCRKHRSAEPWSWFCAAVMLTLTLHWVHYNATISDMTHEISTIAMTDAKNVPAEWVRLSSAAGS